MPPDARFARAEPSASAALVTYSVSQAEIAATRAKYAGLSCDTPAGYEEVRLAIGHVRDTRVAVEKRRVELKADALAYGRLVDSTAKRLTDLLLEVEEPLKAKKAAIDNAAARKRAEAEAEKIRAIEAEIAANRAKQEAESRAVREAEEKRLAEERAALEAERKKLAEAQAKLDAERKAEDARREAARKAEQDRMDAAAKAERERLAEEARIQREKIEAEEKQRRAVREAEEAAQRLEREKLEAEKRRLAAEREAAERAEFERQAKVKAEQEAVEKVERDRVEKARREAELAALRPDVEKVAAFVAQIRALETPMVQSKAIARLLESAWADLDSTAAGLEKAVAEVAS